MTDQLSEREHRCYVSYLLRLWQVGEKDSRAWRASLESVQTGELLGFAGLSALFTFLQNEVRPDEARQATPSSTGEGASIDGW